MPVVGRREFVAALGAAVVWPLAAQAEHQAMPTIGIVAGDAKLLRGSNFLPNVRKGLSEHGYVEDQNFRFDIRDTHLQNERFPIVYREMVDQRVTLFLIYSVQQLGIAKEVTHSIPIVFNIAGDPVENGFVASLNKPGGNLTGVFNLGSTMSGKRLEVLHELIPSASKFAFLTDPGT
jgi:putative ABC transport system substrate-binding protein